MDNVSNIEKIQEALPQRFPILLIDRIVELAPRRKIVAIKNVSINEDFFSGHFPGRPVMPGVLLVEAMIQASMAMFWADKASSASKTPSYSLSSVKAKFVNPVFAGDQLRITVTAIKSVPGAETFAGEAGVAGIETAKAEFTLKFRND